MTTQNQAGVPQTQLLSESGLIAPTANIEYQKRLQERESAAAQLQRRHLLLGNIRIAVFVAIVALAWVFRRPLVLVFLFLLANLLLAAIVLFVVLGIVHRRGVLALNRAKRAAAVYLRGLARMEDRWAGSGETGDEFKDPLHPYAEDLDILGQSSLFQLLSTARTRMGKRCLARWLLAPATAQDIAERQPAIIEFKQKVGLREELAVAGESERIQARPE